MAVNSSPPRTPATDFQLEFLLDDLRTKEKELQNSKSKVIEYLLGQVNTLSMELSISRRHSSTACS